MHRAVPGWQEAGRFSGLCPRGFPQFPPGLGEADRGSGGRLAEGHQHPTDPSPGAPWHRRGAAHQRGSVVLTQLLTNTSPAALPPQSRGVAVRVALGRPVCQAGLRNLTPRPLPPPAGLLLPGGSWPCFWGPRILQVSPPGSSLPQPAEDPR